MSKTDRHNELLKELHQTYVDKNADYGDSFGRTYKELGPISAVTRIADKYHRLVNLYDSDERKLWDESVMDTLMDMANYCLMMVMEMEVKGDTDMSTNQLKELIDRINSLPDHDKKVWVDRLRAEFGEKVVIPKYVADWWEEHNRHVRLYQYLISKENKLKLIARYQEDGLRDCDYKVQNWIEDNPNKFIELVLYDDYEVEQEKKYWIRDKDGFSLLLNEGICISFSTGESIKNQEKNPKYYQFTEQEIKDYDKRYWEFAVEVSE